MREDRTMVRTPLPLLRQHRPGQRRHRGEAAIQPRRRTFAGRPARPEARRRDGEDQTAHLQSWGCCQFAGTDIDERR